MEHIFYGKSFSRPIGYKIMFEESPRDDHHHVGGDEWNLPNCRLCETPMHQLVCLDLKDDRLSELRGEHCEELVLFSCLNCSMLWEEQFFKLDFQNRSAAVIKQEQEEFEKADDEDQIPAPLRHVPVSLVEMEAEDYPTSEERYDEIFTALGTAYFGRVFGKPLLAEDELDLTCCECGQDMTFVALITGENDFDEKYGDLFFGEVILYFSLCPACHILKVEAQSI
ncbi:hypothetical protein [Bacillus haynesii]|uniref:hypothetical protein n=1 Tax=Bacillus haynesii TaxID=1925021 RepID=UPI0015F720B8|nr:hypothetical protein [Bacillus haynesii]MBU8684043.1 hypothetical protein [Bacillus haynesii]MCY8092488.1 hypothetical protein [Bacillus haynesii]MCY8292674.1 hypothetical protein [Bacillus haynesii]MCY8408370.1 hypothetical protein [Bacillus haynesii]MCY8432114.1 hypothetical protein [Bacillus haynesii]